MPVFSAGMCNLLSHVVVRGVTWIMVLLWLLRLSPVVGCDFVVNKLGKRLSVPAVSGTDGA